MYNLEIKEGLDKKFKKINKKDKTMIELIYSSRIDFRNFRAGLVLERQDTFA